MQVQSGDERRILAIVPARGGSKGIPLKNLRSICGRPLVARVADCIREIPLIDRAIVSTDHDEIAHVAEGAGLAAPFRRPPELSGDRIGDWAVLDHALREIERIDGIQYGVVVMLQPTAPLRRPEHVVATIEHLIQGHYDSVWTVTATDLKYHPLKQLTFVDGNLDYHDSRGAQVIARQQLEPVYHRNGIAYAITRQCIFEQKSILGKRAGATVIDGPSVSIDSEDDIATVERILTSPA